MKKSRIFIIFIIVFICILFLLIYINTKKKVSNNNSNTIANNSTKNNKIVTKNEVKVDPPEENKIVYKVDDINDNSTYFTVKAITDNYITTFMNRDKKQITKLLAPSFIKEYNINDKNILNIANIPKYENFMYKILYTNVKQINVSANILEFIVDGKGIVLGKNEKFTYNFMIAVDTADNKYSIYPEKYVKSNGLNELKVGDKIENPNISNIDTTNDFIYVKEKDDIEMAREYLLEYKQLLIYDKDEAYNRLDTEYLKARFVNKEGFYDYLDENKILIALMGLDQYKVVKKDRYIDYVCADKYQNIYTFRQYKDKIMNYTAFLDNYTVVSESDMKKYEEADKLRKSKINMNKLIAMINTKDYNAIYKHLNADFKKRNFKDINDLKRYITTNFYEINGIELLDKEEKSNYYAYTCKLINKRNNDESKEISIVITKTDNNDFKLSFGV